MASKDWASFLGKIVVVDTRSSFVYLGTLTQVDEYFMLLEEADVHDCQDGTSTKERYILEAKKYGIKPNRKSVAIRVPEVISLSSFDTIIEY